MRGKFLLGAAAIAAAAGTAGEAKAQDGGGLLCVTTFHQSGDGYYAGAGEDFAYVVWGEVDRLSDAKAMAEYWAKLHTRSAAEQNADSEPQLLDGAEVTGADCSPLELVLESARGRSWGKTYRAVNRAIVERMRARNIAWFWDDRTPMPASVASEARPVKTEEVAAKKSTADGAKPDDRAAAEAKLAAEAEAAARAREEEAAAARAREEQERLAREERERAERQQAERVQAIYAEQQASAQKALEEEARQKREYEARMAEQQRRDREYEKEQTMFQLAVADQERRQREYLAAEERYKLCQAGNEQACDDIRAGKPVVAKDEPSMEKASTDTDARRCVSQPEVSKSPTWKDALQAVAVNGCETPVDIRICLLRAGGWNCGVQWGVRPQDSMTHFSFETDGELFWDARVAGSSKPLANP